MIKNKHYDVFFRESSNHMDNKVGKITTLADGNYDILDAATTYSGCDQFKQFISKDPVSFDVDDLINLRTKCKKRLIELVKNTNNNDRLNSIGDKLDLILSIVQNDGKQKNPGKSRDCTWKREYDWSDADELGVVDKLTDLIACGLELLDELNEFIGAVLQISNEAGEHNWAVGHVFIQRTKE